MKPNVRDEELDEELESLEDDLYDRELDIVESKISARIVNERLNRHNLSDEWN